MSTHCFNRLTEHVFVDTADKVENLLGLMDVELEVTYGGKRLRELSICVLVTPE